MQIVNRDCNCRALVPAALSAVFALAVGVALVVASPRLTAQQEVKAGPEHEQFKEWEGTWDATVKSVGGESKGVGTWKLGLNGLWLIEHFKADFGGMAFEGHGATSFDAAKKKYVNVWIDSMSTRAMLSEGGYDPKTKTMKLMGEMPLPDGKAMKVTMTTVAKDADTKDFTMTGTGPDGQPMELMQIVYKRRPKQ